ncbi:hypothetical protein STEG23_008345 [Scotinomys teguina]
MISFQTSGGRAGEMSGAVVGMVLAAAAAPVPALASLNDTLSPILQRTPCLPPGFLWVMVLIITTEFKLEDVAREESGLLRWEAVLDHLGESDVIIREKNQRRTHLNVAAVELPPTEKAKKIKSLRKKLRQVEELQQCIQAVEESQPSGEQ